MWTGEGGGEAEGRDEDQGDDPPGHEDHGDGLVLPEPEKIVIMRFEQRKGWSVQ